MGNSGSKATDQISKQAMTTSDNEGANNEREWLASAPAGKQGTMMSTGDWIRPQRQHNKRQQPLWLRFQQAKWCTRTSGSDRIQDNEWWQELASAPAGKHETAERATMMRRAVVQRSKKWPMRPEERRWGKTTAGCRSKADWWASSLCWRKLDYGDPSDAVNKTDSIETWC